MSPSLPKVVSCPQGTAAALGPTQTMVQYSHLGMYECRPSNAIPPCLIAPFVKLKFQKETRFGEMSKLDNEFKQL